MLRFIHICVKVMLVYSMRHFCMVMLQLLPHFQCFNSHSSDNICAVLTVQTTMFLSCLRWGWESSIFNSCHANWFKLKCIL